MKDERGMQMKILRVFPMAILLALLSGLVSCSDIDSAFYHNPAYGMYLGRNGNEYSEEAHDDSVIEIEDWAFDMQVQRIKIFREDYLGRTIRYEGRFMSSVWEGESIYFVARQGGGCCGINGFEVYLNDIPRFDDETWVEVTGILEEFFVEVVNNYFLRLNVITMLEREEP